jgi:hypothetical protein
MNSSDIESGVLAMRCRRGWWNTKSSILRTRLQVDSRCTSKYKMGELEETKFNAMVLPAPLSVRKYAPNE